MCSDVSPISACDATPVRRSKAGFAKTIRWRASQMTTASSHCSASIARLSERSFDETIGLDADTVVLESAREMRPSLSVGHGQRMNLPEADMSVGNRLVANLFSSVAIVEQGTKLERMRLVVDAALRKRTVERQTVAKRCGD